MSSGVGRKVPPGRSQRPDPGEDRKEGSVWRRWWKWEIGFLNESRGIVFWGEFWVGKKRRGGMLVPCVLNRCETTDHQSTGE